MGTDDPELQGRIDITLEFLHQLGKEEACVAIECKRVRPGDTTSNGRYITQGVNGFVRGDYAAGHEWGFMLGYLLALPVEAVTDYIEYRIRQDHGEGAALQQLPTHRQSIAILEGNLIQGGTYSMRMKHIFVDMLPVGP